jgi:hypothetical protein
MFAPESNKTFDLTEHYKTIVLHREYYTDRTESKLYVYRPDTMYIFDVLEPPWRRNQKNSSCIPEGTYNVKLMRWNYKYRYYNYLLTGTGKREGIRIHAGTSKKHTTGCLVMNRYELKRFNKLRLGNFKIIIRS